MRRLAPLAAAALTLTACGVGGGADDEQEITVAAAASLTGSFEEIAEDVEAEHPGTTITLTFAGSSDLAAQIAAGADVDVFASADEANMAKVTDLVRGEPQVFATNVLTIVTEPGNPEGITGLGDLEDPDLDIVLCAPQVPCGAAAQSLAEREELTLAPASEESRVTDVLAKVRAGEADAGLVYVTDATAAADDVAEVEAAGADEVVTTYPIARLTDSETAQAFVEHVTGPAGRTVLAEKGFGAP